jgi:hypothetical protein
MLNGPLFISLFSAAYLLAACGSEEPAAPPVEQGPRAECEQVSLSRCDKLAECAPAQFAATGMTRVDCIQGGASLCLTASESSSQTEPTTLLQCARELAAQSCRDWYHQTEINYCDWRGLGALGNTCTEAWECNSGVCVEGACAEVPAQLGATCNPLPGCAGDLACAGDPATCQARLLPGADCVDSELCPYPTTCISLVCSPFLEPGAACTEAAECGDNWGGDCDNGVCVEG